MNFAHVHLMLNHIPVLTLPMALLFLALAVWKKNEEFKKLSLIILILTALTAIPTYLTGDPAEDVVKRRADISKEIIEEHEEAGETSLILTLITGALAVGTLAVWQKPLWKQRGLALVFISGVISVGSLGFTANLGGQVHHPEIRGESGN
jgi:uncharacterized membrane protein